MPTVCIWQCILLSYTDFPPNKGRMIWVKVSHLEWGENFFLSVCCRQFWSVIVFSREAEPGGCLSTQCEYICRTEISNKEQNKSFACSLNLKATAILRDRKNKNVSGLTLQRRDWHLEKLNDLLKVIKS